MTALWVAGDMAAAMGGAIHGPVAGEVGGLSIDTRSLKPGEAFFALRGEGRDGHDYVAEALKKGAALAVIAGDKRPSLAPEGGYISVDEPLAALNRLAAAARQRSQARLVAVTGSVGKTSTKEALKLVLSASGPTHAAAASFNNHIGVPLTLASMPEASAYGVFEIGMNHAGEITPLTKLVRPHVAIVTTIAPAHLEYFGGLEAIAEAKSEIFSGLEAGGAALINRDNEQHGLLARRARENGARVVYFGADEACEVRLLGLHMDGAGSIVDALIFGTPATYKIGAPGRHLVQNSLAVLGAVALLGADLALAALELVNLRAPKGRGERLKLRLPRGGSFTLIDESYNANPSSMAAAFSLLGVSKPSGGGRRVAILGDMLELGADASSLHRGLAQPIKEAHIDMVLTAGKLMENLHEALPPGLRGRHAASAAELEPSVLALPQAGDVIMAKGSNGSRVGAIVEALKTRYPLEELDSGAEEA